MHRVFDRATGYEKHISRRAVGKSVIGNDFLAKDCMDWFLFFRHRENLETSFAKCLPRSRVIDNFRAIEQQNGHGCSMLASASALLNQRHPAIRAGGRLIECPIVRGASAFGANISLHILCKASCYRRGTESCAQYGDD